MKADEIARGPQNQPQPVPAQPAQPETESLIPKTTLGWILTIGAAALSYSFARGVMNNIKRDDKG